MKYFFLYIFILLSACNPKTQKVKKAETPYDYNVEEKITELNIELNPQKIPAGLKFKWPHKSGNMIYLSGNGSISGSGERIEGKVGVDLTTKQGYEAARLTAINHLSF